MLVLHVLQGNIQVCQQPNLHFAAGDMQICSATRYMINEGLKNCSWLRSDLEQASKLCVAGCTEEGPACHDDAGDNRRQLP